MERLDEFISRVNPERGECDARRLELTFDQFRVSGIVFQHQYANR
jgi:hypothetical protein